jgi:DNA ligase (NAD+)
LPTEDSVESFLIEHGFKTPFNSTLYLEPVKVDIAQWKRIVDNAPYFCDGIVVSLNDRKLQRELGDSTTAPRYAKAYKWQNETGESVILSIDFETGRTGHVVPIANIEPTDLSGATISRVTLHNIGYLRKHAINEGATIAIVRAGEIIPKHLETIETTGILNIPDKCTSCNSKLVEEVNEDDTEKSSLYCKNAECPEQSFQRILYFIETVNIEHMGPSILKALVDDEIVKKVSDIYTLTVKDIANAGSNKNIGSSTGKKIVESIAANKEMELTTFIAALGIPGMSKGTAERLVEKFGNIDTLMSAKKEDFVGIRDFGDITVDIVYEGLKNNKDLINQLIKFVTFKEKKVVTGGKLQGLKFVITGTLMSGTREAVEADIVAAGGVLQSAVSKNTNYLVIGESPGESKTTKAAKLGVPTLTEDNLVKMMK